MQDLVGKSLGGYSLVEKLGSGITGAVYRAESAGNVAAIKVLHPDHELREAHDRFKREIDLHTSLEHPHIARVLDAGREGPYGFLILEYLDGSTLRDLIEERAPLPREEALSLCIQIIDALVYLHGRGVAHRDLKPLNVMAMPDGTLKLLDFGLSVSDIHTRITQADSFLGTLRYSAPEVAAGNALPDKPADIHAVGLILYELLSRRRAFEASRPIELIALLCGAPPKPLIEHGIQIGADVERLLADLLAKDPQARPDANRVRKRLIQLARVMTSQGIHISRQWKAIGKRSGESLEVESAQLEKDGVSIQDSGDTPAPDPKAMARSTRDRGPHPMAAQFTLFAGFMLVFGFVVMITAAFTSLGR